MSYNINSIAIALIISFVSMFVYFGNIEKQISSNKQSIRHIEKRIAEDRERIENRRVEDQGRIEKAFDAIENRIYADKV